MFYYTMEYLYMQSSRLNPSLQFVCTYSPSASYVSSE